MYNVICCIPVPAALEDGMILDISALLSGEKHRLDFEYPLHVQIDADDHSVNLSNVEFPEAGNVRGYVTDNAGYMR